MAFALRSAFPSLWRGTPRPWARWLSSSPPPGAHAVTAVQVGDTCRAVRVQVQPNGRLQLAGMAEGTLADLARDKLLFDASQAVLVLGAEERHLMTLDKPEVPDAELAMAVRWPLGEALEIDAQQLLVTALTLPRINEALRPQVLAVACRQTVAQGHVARLAAVGVKIRSIDVSDSALRGMALLQPAGDNDGCVVLAFIGAGISIGLLWQGRFCALRTLALPVRQPRDEAEFEEHLALHIQRTADHFERQAIQLSVRRVLASMPSLPPAARESVRLALPLSAQLFDLSTVMDMDPATQAACNSGNDLNALACVAAGRLIDSGAATPPSAVLMEAGAS